MGNYSGILIIGAVLLVVFLYLITPKSKGNISESSNAGKEISDRMLDRRYSMDISHAKSIVWAKAAVLVLIPALVDALLSKEHLNYMHVFWVLLGFIMMILGMITMMKR